VLLKLTLYPQKSKFSDYVNAFVSIGSKINII